MAAPDFPRLRRRMALTAAILMTAGALALIALTQPPEGQVAGVCMDADTGKPLAHVLISLDRDTGRDTDDEDDAETPPRNARGDTSAPPGWHQDSQRDTELDAAGEAPDKKDHWSARTDAQGHFSLQHLPAGEYKLQASSSGHELDKERTVIITDGHTERLALALDRYASSLGFEISTRNWTPQESPVLPLHGLLLTRAVGVSVDRLDLNGTLAHQPDLLAGPEDRASDAEGADKTPQWPGQFSPVRHWTYTVTQADAEGSFVERVPLGPLPPGMYRVTAHTRDDGDSVTAIAWALVTHLVLVRKTFGGQMLAYVTDIATGQPVANASVLLYDQVGKAGKLLRQARTSPEGLARLSTQGGGEESEGTLVARDGASVVALSQNLNSPGSNGTASSGRDLRAFLYTDRPVYRPGQSVHIKGVTRWFDPKAGFSVPAGQSVTLDVRDGQDTLISHQQLTTDEFGSWAATLALSPEALTGEYTIRTQMGEETQEATFDVAAYHKPEYQASVTFSKDRYIRGETIDATVTASYYYGAPVAGAEAQITAYRADDSGREQAHPFRFRAGEEENTEAGEQTVDETVHLDDKGQAHVRIPTKDAPEDSGDQTYTVQADVKDTSGEDIHAEGTATVAQGLFSLEATPSAQFCHPGDPLTVAVKAAGEGGGPQAGQAVTIKTVYEAWRDGREVDTPVSDVHITTGPDGQAAVPLSVPRAGDLTVRLSATDARGNTITTETDIPVLGASEDLPAETPDLSVMLDKKRYGPGQTAHVLISTAHPGPSALVTVEGRTLYHAYVVPLARRATAMDLPIGAEDAPGVTVSVCCVWNKQFLSSRDDENLVVADDRRILNVSVAADRQNYHSGDPATIRVQTRDAQGRLVPAEVSIGVVDEAIYAIQPESSDTIGEAMQAEQYDAVQTESSCKEIYEGDVDKGETGIDIRRKFPDTALWRPAVRTGPDGLATVPLTLPDNLTTWRITCVGETKDTRVGKGVGKFTVNKDLLVRLETPPFLTAGDTGQFIALVHNNTNAPLQAQVKLAATGLTVSRDDLTRTVSVPPGAPARLTWDVSAAQPGPIQAQVTAQAGPLSDGVAQPIPVLPHGAIQDVWHSGTLLHRVSQSITLDPAALPGSSVLHVRLAPSLASLVLPALDYLAAYPYSSTDATVSAFLPDLALGGAANPFRLSDKTCARLRDMTQRGVLRLARFQNSGGGWGWFSTGKPDLWMTADAAWGLARAHDAGFRVTPSVLDAAARSLRSQVIDAERSARPGKDTDLALASLALAHLGRAQDAQDTLRYLQSRWLAVPASPRCADLARAALASERLGPDGHVQALSLVNQLGRGARQTGTLVSWPARFHPQAAGIAEDAPDTEATAWALLAAESVLPGDPRADGAARWLMTRLSGDHWGDPDTTAVVLLALTQYMSRAQEGQPDFTAKLFLNGHPVRQIRFGVGSVFQPDRVIDVPGAALHAGANTVSLEKVGMGRLYYSLDLRQCLAQPTAPPPPTLWTRLVDHIRYPDGVPLPPAPSGYRVRRVYLRLTSRRNFLWEDTVPAPDTHLNAGESVLVRLIIDCVRPGSRVVVEEPVPAGCRVAEVSGEDAGTWDNWWDYTDVRDDRIVFFVHDMTRGEHEIDYHLQAQTPGAYDVMPTLLTSTADPTLYALGGHADKIQIDAKE